MQTDRPLRLACGDPPPRSGEDQGRVKHRTVGAPDELVKRARKQRQEMSLPEVLLWMQLQKRPGGHKFRKQCPQAGFTLDFACLASRLVIEVDGEAHNRGDQPEFDEYRDAALRSFGFSTLRLSARDVLKNMESVVTHIVQACNERATNPPRNGEVARRRRDGGVA